VTDPKIPGSPTSSGTTETKWQPHELNPDLAAAKMANDLVDKMGAPSILTTPFVVRYGIFSGLNHTPTNRTGYDCSMRLAVYRMVAHESVNVNGAYFEKVWQYLMKPKVVVQGMQGQPAFQQEEEKESILSRMIGFFKGGKKNDTNSNDRG
jgi:hypothetical protein